ncbi:hypothetical protein SUGI_1107550 [Cryptomeria japonica]|nr:hypothetical protein SUGI_1107550 [Cryptomeria japonica]
MHPEVELLVLIEELLQKESREDAQFWTQFGTRRTKSQSSTLTKNLQDESNKVIWNKVQKENPKISAAATK